MPPKYYILFDNTFITVKLVPETEEPPSFCNQIDLESYTLRVPLDPSSVVQLQDDWLNPEELEEKLCQ